jgi:rRNA processing protein Gar1
LEEKAKALQRVGYVLHMSSSKNLILRADIMPRIGDKVFNETLKPIGTISDIFGSVSSPFVSVKPSVMEPQKLIKRALYVNSSFKQRGGRKN